MRRVRYRVASSLDGFIAGPNGDIDWIVHDPTVDFQSLYAGVDTVLVGRRTYELTLQPGAPPWPAGWRIYVFSRTLDPAKHPGVTVVGADANAVVSSLKKEEGPDIWLFGGAALFATLLRAQLVDRIEVAVMPVLLGGGTPLVSSGRGRAQLKLRRADTSPSGILHVDYDIEGGG